jgi:hypothetical protein
MPASVTTSTSTGGPRVPAVNGTFLCHVCARIKALETTIR